MGEDNYVGVCLHNTLASYLNKRKAIHSLFALGLMNSESKKFTTGVSLPILDFLSTTEQTLLQIYFQTAELWQKASDCETACYNFFHSTVALPWGKDSSALNQDTNPACSELFRSTVFTPLSPPLQITAVANSVPTANQNRKLPIGFELT